MKSPRRLFCFFRFFFFLSLLCFVSPAGPAAQEPEKGPGSVVILPFSIHADGDLSYLEEGLRAMLASRLAAEAGVMVANHARVDRILQGRAASESVIQELCQTLGAGHLVTGSLTALAGGISLDAQVYRHGADSPVHFGVRAENDREIFRSIDQLAREISGRIFGIRAPSFSAGTPENRLEPEAPRSVPFRAAHPEKPFLDSGTGATRLSSEPLEWAQISTGNNFNFALLAFEAGDLTGDGAAEIALTNGSTIFVYRLAAGRLEEMASLPVEPPHRAHWLSMADLDGDGRQELYISAASVSGPRSLAYAWDGSGFEPLFQAVPWYIRAMALPGEGPALLGQRHAKNPVLQPGILRLQLAGGALQEGRQLELPDWLNIFDFSLADVTGDGGLEIIHLDQDDHLLLSRADGTVLWRSGETYGGSKRFLGGEDRAAKQQEFYQPGYMEAPRYFLPSRILSVDLNGDGSAEILINRNHAKAVPLLGKLRAYGSGEINVLSWDGAALARIWQSRNLEGYIVDYLLQPGGEGDHRLMVGIERDGNGLLSKMSGRESSILTLTVK